MEFHVCAKLDYEGKIQSVQSTCTPSPQTESQRWPGCDIDFFNQLAGKGPNQETKLVPYAEKKELVYKMDAKIDQMSEIVIQLDELNKRVKVQEKLIKQYEEKIASQENRIQELESENAMLRDSSNLRGISSSDQHSSVTLPKCIEYSKDWPTEWNEKQATKSFSWPRRKATHTTTHDSKGLVENVTERNKSSLDDVDGPSYEFEQRNKVHRPSSLNVGVDISSSSISGNEFDVKCHFNTCKGDGCRKNGYSYVKKDVDLNVNSSEVPCHRCAVYKKSNSNEFKHVSSTSSLGFGDQNEYLDMNPQFTLDDLDKSEMSASDSSREQPNDISLCEEAVHGSWRNNQIVYHHQSEENVESPSDKYISNDGYIRPEVHDVPSYVVIIDNSVENSNRPPLPLPRQRSSSLVTSVPRQHDTYQQSNNNGRPMPSSSSFSNSSTASDQSPTREKRDMRKMSMPVSCLEHDMQLLTDKRSTCSNSRSTRSADRSPVRSELRGEWMLDSPTSARNGTESNRDHNSESRKDDRLNKLLKDMRTTMEWNEAKKKLILKKEQTTEQVEEKFRSFVKDMFEAFCQLQRDRAKQMQKCSTDTLLNKISDKMGTPLAREIISEAFMKKCLDFLMITCKLPSP